jgi:hypothetical protein
MLQQHKPTPRKRSALWSGVAVALGVGGTLMQITLWAMERLRGANTQMLFFAALFLIPFLMGLVAGTCWHGDYTEVPKSTKSAPKTWARTLIVTGVGLVALWFLLQKSEPFETLFCLGFVVWLVVELGAQCALHIGRRKP